MKRTGLFCSILHDPHHAAFAALLTPVFLQKTTELLSIHLADKYNKTMLCPIEHLLDAVYMYPVLYDL